MAAFWPEPDPAFMDGALATVDPKENFYVPPLATQCGRHHVQLHMSAILF
jgi:hypothetical protein